MAPVIRNPAAWAAAGKLSPSSQAAWCGSPQAICTTSNPNRPSNRCSSGTLLTCNDQLHTPIASASMATAHLRKEEGGRMQDEIATAGLDGSGSRFLVHPSAFLRSAGCRLD